jgi:FtsP/CotA-like multicopper oxidase with cupredoxin domain
VAETYDVIVRPQENKAYTLFAESMGRSGYASGTLAPDPNQIAAAPARRAPPTLTMADMGMHEGMDHSAMGHGDMAGMDHTKMPMGAMSGMDHSKMGHDDMADMDHTKMPIGAMSGMDHSKMATAAPVDPFYAQGSGLIPAATDGGKFLSYADLRAQKPLYKERKPTRELELRLTGNMERYIWSINDIKYEDAEPIRLKYGERVRFKFINETMMTHPMHLHGMWSILDVGAGQWNPIKHVVSVAPGTTVYMETEVDAPGNWVFHCHLSYHMAAGMFRNVIVEGGPDAASSSLTGGGAL